MNPAEHKPNCQGTDAPWAHIPLEPSALQHGQLILRAAMEYGFVGSLDIDANEFHPDLQSSALIIRNARDKGARDFTEIVLHLCHTIPAGLPQDLARSHIVEISEYPPHHPDMLCSSAEVVKNYSRTKARVAAGWKLQNILTAGDDPTELLREIERLGSNNRQESVASQLQQRAFNADVVPAKPIPILKMNGKNVLTEGNLLNVQAQLKAGKSAVIGAIIAAIFPFGRRDADTLGFSAENLEELAVVHFDTEQSRFDHDSLVRKSLKRVGINEPPNWFESYSITDLDIDARVEAFHAAVAKATEAHGGVFALILDGIADLCRDPNDATDSFELVRSLHAMAMSYNCGIITVLHENPGSDGGKTRGHLGSQLARKAETNLRLAKDEGGISTMWADQSRHGHTPRSQGTCFSWSEGAGMHISRGTVGAIKACTRNAKFREEAEDAFGDEESLNYRDLVSAIMRVTDLKEDSGKKRVRHYLDEGIIDKKSSIEGSYRLIPAPSVKV